MMKRVAYCLLALCGFSLTVGCGELARKANEVKDAAQRRAIDKAAEAGHNATDEAIDGAADSATQKKDADDTNKRKALNGKDDPDN